MTDDKFDKALEEFDKEFFQSLQQFLPSTSSEAKLPEFYNFNPNTRRSTGRSNEQRGGGRRNKTRGKRAK